MKKQLLLVTFVLVTLAVSSLFAQENNSKMTRSFSNPAENSLTGFGRDVYAGCDLDQDGLPEIIVTQYQDLGAVQIFEVTADNTMEEVWRSEAFGSSYSSNIRTVAVGDLDGNGIDELCVAINAYSVAEMDTAGIAVFQWDGVTDNGYVEVARLNHVNNPALVDTGYYRCEDMVMADFDNDGKNEIAFVRWEISTKTDSRAAYIFSVDGDLASGFYTWVREWKQTRYELDSGGSITGAYYADLDKDNHGELWISCYNYLSLRAVESTGPNAYVDSAHVARLDKIDLGADTYIIKGFVTGDIDGDGTNEILVEGTHTGKVFLVKAFGDVQDSVYATELSFLKPGAFTTLALGDQDHTTGSDGIDLYSGGTSVGIVDYEFTGGALTDSINWVRYEFGADTAAIDTYQVMHVNTGVIPWDTTYVDTTSAVKSPSWKVFVPKIDMDGDGRKELVATYLVAGSTADIDTTAKGTTILPENKRWIQVFELDPATGMRDAGWKVITADDFRLQQNYPNPFNPTTTIEYYLPINKKISLTIYNSLGQKIKTLVDNELMTSGSHVAEWDGTNTSGVKVATGMYVYELKYGNFKQHKRMTLLK